MPSYAEVCDGIERLLADPGFSAEIQRRVARVTAVAVAQVFNTGTHSDRALQERYADALSAGLEGIWSALADPRDASSGTDSTFGAVKRKSEPEFYPFRHIHMSKAILYVNSLGIRWKVLETGTQDHYDFRVAVYLAGFDKKKRAMENRYNRKIFSKGSPHFLNLLCRETKVQRLLLALPGTFPSMRDEETESCGCPFRALHLPQPSSLSTQKSRKILSKSIADENGQLILVKAGGEKLRRIGLDELRDLFPLGEFGAEESKLIKLPLSFAELEGSPFPPLSYFNLFKLFADRGEREGDRFLVYLPDPAMPGLEPAGFAGNPVVAGTPDPTAADYGRFLFLLQSFLCRYFARPAAISESEIIQVALEKGIRSEQTWRGMFVDEEKSPPGKPIPLLKDFSARDRRVRGTTDQNDPDPFFWDEESEDEESEFKTPFHRVCQILAEKFISRVIHTEPMGSDATIPPERLACYRTDSSTEQAHFAVLRELIHLGAGSPDPRQDLRQLSSAPAFGYHALATLAYDTIVALWRELGVYKDPDSAGKHPFGKEGGGDLLSLVKQLLFSEPTLHYIESYRDHFLHSLNVLLLGYWFLAIKATGTNVKGFALFNKVKGSSRIRLLKLWTIAASIHDFAYPLQKMKDGASILFSQYSNGGKEPYEAIIAQQWWDPIRRPNTFRFIHEILREVSGNSLGGTPPALFYLKQGKRKNPVMSHELAAALLTLLFKNGDHGVMGALLLHNHFLEYHSLYDVISDDREAVCTALAMHHIMDYEKIEQGTVDNWRLAGDGINDDQNVAHQLVALLILCDACSQWGRTRTCKDLGINGTDGIDKERKIEAKLVSIGPNEPFSRYGLDIYYPNLRQDGEIARVKEYYDRPIKLLRQLGESFDFNVRLYGVRNGERTDHPALAGWSLE